MTPEKVKDIREKLKHALSCIDARLDLVDDIFEKRKYFLEEMDGCSNEQIFKNGIMAAIQILSQKVNND